MCAGALTLPGERLREGRVWESSSASLKERRELTSPSSGGDRRRSGSPSRDRDRDRDRDRSNRSRSRDRDRDRDRGLERNRDRDKDRDKKDRSRSRDRERDRDRDQSRQHARDRDRGGDDRRERDRSSRDFDDKRIPRGDVASNRSRSKERAGSDRGRSRSRDRPRTFDSDRSRPVDKGPNQAGASKVWTPLLREAGDDGSRRESTSRAGHEIGAAERDRGGPDSRSDKHGQSSQPAGVGGSFGSPPFNADPRTHGNVPQPSDGARATQYSSGSAATAPVPEPSAMPIPLAASQPKVPNAAGTTSGDGFVPMGRGIPTDQAVADAAAADSRQIPADGLHGKARQKPSAPFGWAVEDVEEGCAVWQGRLGKAASGGAQVGQSGCESLRTVRALLNHIRLYLCQHDIES